MLNKCFYSQEYCYYYYYYYYYYCYYYYYYYYYYHFYYFYYYYYYYYQHFLIWYWYSYKQTNPNFSCFESTNYNANLLQTLTSVDYFITRIFIIFTKYVWIIFVFLFKFTIVIKLYKFGENLWNNVKKSSETGHDQISLFSNFT